MNYVALLKAYKSHGYCTGPELLSVYSIKQAYSCIRVGSLSSPKVVNDASAPGRHMTVTGQTSVILYRPTVHSHFIHLEISFPCHSIT